MALRPPGLQHKHDMMATWGRPRTTRVMCWLQRLTEYQHGGFCVAGEKLRAQRT